MDIPRGSKEYNRASLKSIQKSSEDIVKAARYIRAFKSNDDLLKQMVRDKIKKLVSLEIGLSMRDKINDIKDKDIRMYSVQNLTDAMWQKDPAIINLMDRVYYSSVHTMTRHHTFAGVKYNSQRDHVASPLYDILDSTSNKNILVLLPNLLTDQVNPSFGNANNFFKIIKNLSKSGNLIFKTRKKQWFPEQIKQYAQEIVYDGAIMYPSALSNILKKVDIVVMFYSSGLYECIYAGKYIVNIELPVLKRWRWPKKYLSEYFAKDEGSLYNFKGVIETVEQGQAMSDTWRIQHNLDTKSSNLWLDKYIGKLPKSNTKFIVNNIVSS